MRLSPMIAILLVSGAGALDFETPPPESVSAILPPDLASGPDFHVVDPVESDGLMHHYAIDSRFGTFTAYGVEELKIRVKEVGALAQISKKSDIGVAAKAVEQHVEGDIKTVAKVVTDPVGLVTGIPKGIAHLFGGAKAQAGEVSDSVKRSDGTSGAKNVLHTAKADAVKYADRYLGVSAAERRYFQELGVDPYTSNAVLRKAVHHFATVQATVNLGMHFVGVPGLPYLSDVRQAMDAIYTEDPAVLRARQRKVLAAYGLSAAEIARYENTLLLSPTRQSLLAEDAKMLEGVEGRDELFRHAMSLTTDEEVLVFLESTRLLVRVQAREPIARILPGLRLPTAETRDGRIAVFGAFDAVYWTEQVSAYETTLHSALPPGSKAMELWLSGAVSASARAELTTRGWGVHDHAWDGRPAT